MQTLTQWWENLWEQVRRGPAVLPTRYSIPQDRIDKTMGVPFRRDQHYFVVKVNRIFLNYPRQFWTTYAPMALVVSEFLYSGQNTVVPFVVGPSLLEKDHIELPAGFMFLDTKVAGIHPYKGGGLKLTVILYRVKRTNVAAKLLKVIENVASALDFSQTLSSYLKIANVMVDTVGELLGLDETNQPIIGLRKEFASGDEFMPGYFALIDSDNIDENKLWVRGNELIYGDTANGEKFTAANYILYSIGQSTKRDDYDQLAPIGEMWNQVKAEATHTKDESWQNAKVAMSALYTALLLSPDIAEDHANELNDELVERMVRIHKRTMENIGLGATSREADPLEKARRKALDVLKL